MVPPTVKVALDATFRTAPLYTVTLPLPKSASMSTVTVPEEMVTGVPPTGTEPQVHFVGSDQLPVPDHVRATSTEPETPTVTVVFPVEAI